MPLSVRGWTGQKQPRAPSEVVACVLVRGTADWFYPVYPLFTWSRQHERWA